MAKNTGKKVREFCQSGKVGTLVFSVIKMYENTSDLRIGGIFYLCAKLLSQSLIQVNKSN